jgi:tight adherence protein C
VDPIVVTLLSFLAVAGVTFLAGFLLLRVFPAIRAERFVRLESSAAPGTILRFEDTEPPWWRRTLERLGQIPLRSQQAVPSRLRERLIQAGYHNPEAAIVFTGVKVGLGVAGALAYFAYSVATSQVVPDLLIVSILLAGIGYIAPEYWLSNRIKARQRDVVHALPDVLDLLMVCVEAGMGFDAAVARVSEQPEMRSSPLHQEMLRMHLEVRAGRPRAEALRALAERTGAQEVKAMVGAFIQTEKLGTPLGKTLRIYADTARVQRRHRAEEQAHLAPLKMLFPTVFFLMPAFFLVALAPSLLGLAKLFKGLSQ